MFALGNIEAAQAQTLADQGKTEEYERMFEQAEETHTQSLRLYQTVLGKTHHKTADARHKCAWYRHRQRDYVNAK